MEMVLGLDVVVGAFRSDVFGVLDIIPNLLVLG